MHSPGNSLLPLCNWFARAARTICMQLTHFPCAKSCYIVFIFSFICFPAAKFSPRNKQWFESAKWDAPVRASVEWWILNFCSMTYCTPTNLNGIAAIYKGQIADLLETTKCVPNDVIRIMQRKKAYTAQRQYAMCICVLRRCDAILCMRKKIFSAWILGAF